MLDASNDNDLAKIYPTTFRIFDINYSRLTTKFFDINLTEGANASTEVAMFSSVDKEIKKIHIPWEYCLADVDNTNANIGDHNSMKSRALQENSTTIKSGCVWPFLHNGICKAGSLFSNITSFGIGDHAKKNLSKYFEFCD